MSDAGEKNYSATPSRIAKARREGNVARTQELGANVAFIAAAACVVAIAPSIAQVARGALVAAASGRSSESSAIALVGLACAVIAAAACGGTVASLLQSGFLFVVPAPKFSRLQPAEGFKRMVSKETLTHAVRALAAFTLSGGAVVASMNAVVACALRGTGAFGIASVAWSASQHAAFAAAGVGTLFAALEYGVARSTWLAKLKMSLHELKRELKEHDGDPAARGRRRALHRSLIRGSMNRVKDAAFVVVNPTHVAVALDYRPPDVPVPVVLVRAADEMALRVREAALQARIPIVENVRVARALFAQAGVGEAIPHEHYVAVAEIVASLVRSGALE